MSTRDLQEAQVNKGVGGKLRILVVEQEPIAREILADLLKMAGYDVLATHNGEQALLTLMQERGRLDCLFTAVELPGLVDGWMLAEEFRSTDAAGPVVFATGQERTAQTPPATAFVARPLLPPQVVEAINGLTGRSEAALASRPLARADAAAPPVAATPSAPSEALLRAAG
ncbi:MAG TPA: response regulator [Beijerinckiaceae bacterium]|nr:response regulator [Beijerinckiaceae bacterium]